MRAVDYFAALGGSVLKGLGKFQQNSITNTTSKLGYHVDFGLLRPSFIFTLSPPPSLRPLRAQAPDAYEQ